MNQKRLNGYKSELMTQGLKRSATISYAIERQKRAEQKKKSRMTFKEETKKLIS
jgi:hypothetical protein